MTKGKLPRTRRELEAAMQQVQESAYEKGKVDGYGAGWNDNEVAKAKEDTTSKACDIASPTRQLTPVEHVADAIARKQEARALLQDRQRQLVADLTDVNTNLATNKLDHLELLRQLDKYSA